VQDVEAPDLQALVNMSANNPSGTISLE
jgi:hypothetical protein